MACGSVDILPLPIKLLKSEDGGLPSSCKTWLKSLPS